MSRPDVISIVGGRPQLMKLAVVSKAIRALGIDEKIINTGQHYDHDLFSTHIEALGIPEPDYNLGVGSYSHGKQTGLMMIGIEDLLKRIGPAMVIVYGDTNSTLAGALAAAKLKIPVAHVEAGARNFSMDIPEEINRTVADHVSTLLFCATANCAKNLGLERVRRGVSYTGDVMYDLHLGMREHAKEIASQKPILVTIHRPSNTDDEQNLRNIAEAVIELSKKEFVVWPMHPRCKERLIGIGQYRHISNTPIELPGPLNYISFLGLELHAKAILTDSGGVQREAYFSKCPCVTVFPNTAWPETVDSGWNTLVKADKDEIVRAVFCAEPGRGAGDAFGNGTAGGSIARSISTYLRHAPDVYTMRAQR